MGCSPRGREESDTTERLHFHFSVSCTGEGNGNPLQCSCLENPGDGGAWWASVYGVAQSRTRLKRLSRSSSMQLNTIKTNNPIKKWGKDLNKHFSKEDIQMLTNTWKDAQHHSLLEKCKSKPQWGTISRQSEWLLSKSTSNKFWRGCGEKRTLLHCWWECKLVQPLWRTVWRFLKKLEI